MASQSNEVARQIAVYESLGYPAMGDVSAAEFRALFDGVAARLADVEEPFALVVTRAFIDPEKRVPLMSLAKGKRPGVVDRNHWSDARPGLAPYDPISILDVPDAHVYAIVGFERGDQYRNVAPVDAIPEIITRRRTPLTIDEGISLVTLFPALLEKNHCFMLGGSDRGDRRMPALWISDRAPKLGWCFKGNPHTWLGVASVSRRVGA